MRAAVLGSPIAHSLSPVLHRAAYAAMGLTEWRYDAFECVEDDLAGFLDGLDESWAGLSLTMPLKRVALKLADHSGATALAVGGANTLIFRDGLTLAENTDVYGIVSALAEAGLGRPRKALVLGGGATAASALVALRELGLERATLVVRDRTRAGEAAGAGERAGVRIAIRTLTELADLLPGTDLVVSTLPGGAADPYARQWGAEIAAVGAALFDVIYAPWPTALGAAVRASGGTVLGGFPMLLHQAVRQVSLMTGRQDVPIEAMRAAGSGELAARQA